MWHLAAALLFSGFGLCRMDDFSNGYCADMRPQRYMTIEQLLGMWYGLEIISHKQHEERLGIHYEDFCPIILVFEDHSPTVPPNIYSEDIKRLRLVWDEDGSYVEYTLRYNVSKPGLWISSGPQNGSSFEPQYNQVAGTIQVIKALGNLLVLTFCHRLPDQQLYTVLLSRIPQLSKQEISDAHELLTRRGLETHNIKRTCSQNTAPTNHLNVLLVRLLRGTIFWSTRNLVKPSGAPRKFAARVQDLICLAYVCRQ